MIKKLVKRIYFMILQKKKNLTVYSEDCSLKTKFGTNIEIGKNTFVDRNCNIGSYSYIGKNCNITKATIGRYCSIANNVSIGQGEHDLTKISTSSVFYNSSYEELTKKECVIGNDVWIGTDSVVLRDVKVGDGAVIGANSVVTKDIPPFAVVVGSPARIIKYRFDDKNIKKIIESKWFEYDIEEAKKVIKELKSE